MKWTEIAFRPDKETVRQAAEAWRWAIDEPWTALVCSMFGGLFLERQSGGVFWLECPAGTLKHVSEDAASFNRFMSGERDAHWSEQIEEWFLPPFVQKLRDAGKIPEFYQCYGMTILPVFEGGAYSVDNVFLCPQREWLTYTGTMHRQLQDIPDGGKVRIVVEP